MNKVKIEFVLNAIVALAFGLPMTACDGGGGTSPTENEPDAPEPVYETIIDERDGTEYKIVKIGERWWMAENLKYEVEGAKAVYYGPYLGGDTTELDGFAYDWATAMGLDSSFLELSAEVLDALDSVHRGICPNGLHIPSKDEWQMLEDYVDLHNGSENVSTSLTSLSGWKLSFSGVEQGTNRYGFAATPSDGTYNAKFISSTEIHREWRTDMPNFWTYQLTCYRRYGFFQTDKSNFYFVRCVKNGEPM